MTTKKTDTSTERDGVPTPDPAVVAGKEAAEAIAACNATDIDTPEFKVAQERAGKADAAFADAPVTSAAGALAKMRELKTLVIDLEEGGLDARHIKTVVAFLEGRVVAAEPDPAVAVLAEYRVANAALEAFPDDEAEADTPEYEAASARRYAARGAVYDAVPTSLAGVAAKVRFILDHEERGNDLWPAFDTMAKSMLPFLEGAPAPEPKPDPVVTLFAKWGTLQDEAAALGKTDPEGADPRVGKKHDELYDRQSAVERQIIETAATSVGGIAVKLRLLAYIEFPMKGLPDLHRTPAKDTDFKGMIEAWREDKGLDWQDDLLIGALRDAERLAGVS